VLRAATDAVMLMRANHYCSENVFGRPLLVKPLLNLRDGTASISVGRHIGGTQQSGGAKVELLADGATQVGSTIFYVYGTIVI
jgi:hypothetical protein